MAGKEGVSGSEFLEQMAAKLCNLSKNGAPKLDFIFLKTK